MSLLQTSEHKVDQDRTSHSDDGIKLWVELIDSLDCNFDQLDRSDKDTGRSRRRFENAVEIAKATFVDTLVTSLVSTFSLPKAGDLFPELTG